MNQPHPERSVEHSDGQQNASNHTEPDAPDAHGADEFSGTRAGKANIEALQQSLKR